MVIGGQVFGYSDAPIHREGNFLSAVAPDALLIAHPSVTVTALFAPSDFRDSFRVTAFDALSQTEHLVILEQGKDFARFLLFGNRLKDVKVLRPQSVKIQPLGRPEDANTLWLIELSAAQIKAHKHLVLQRKDDRPILVLLPALEFKEEKGPEPKPKPKERITVNADAVVIEGEGLKEI